MCLAIPGRAEEITSDGVIKIGRVNFGGVVKRDCLDYVPEIAVGDYAIVHVGFAIAVIDENTAQETLETFRDLGVLEEEVATEEVVFARGGAAPGCPVGVRALELIGKALANAAQPGVIFCSVGDMLRVPGTEADLFQVKGRGAGVRVVYSPLDAVELAVKNPDRQVVFFGVGFETTGPANAMSVHVAKRRGLKNFSVLVSHVLVPPAIEAIMSSPGNQVQAFLAAGHVCSVMGYW